MERCKEAVSLEHLPNKQLLIMKEIKEALQIRDYEIERIAKKIKSWHPQCNECVLKLLLEYTNSNIGLFFTLLEEDNDINSAVHGSIHYAISILKLSYGIEFNNEQYVWITESMITLIHDIINQVPEDNN